MDKIIALVPLRGGSKSIPKKNIRPIAGKPLCAWVLEAAANCGLFNKIVVSTESDEIRDVVNGMNLGVEVLQRPARIATDSSSTESVMIDVGGRVDFDILFTIQATSPLLTPQDLKSAYEKFTSEKLDSLLSGCRVKRFFWTLDGRPVNYDPSHRPMRQDFEGVMAENGAFYITKRGILEKFKCRVGGNIGIYEMPPDRSVEVDEPADWDIAEGLLLRARREDLQKLAGRIRALFVDVDGTMTDGGMYYSAQGDTLRRFNTRDAKGLEIIRKAGVETAIISSEESDITRSRSDKLGIKHCYLGVKDKQALVTRICGELAIPLSEAGFVGDDLNDVEIMKTAGFSACPADAVTEVKQAALYVSSFKGGQGAVRDVCDLIVKSRVLSAGRR